MHPHHPNRIWKYYGFGLVSFILISCGSATQAPQDTYDPSASSQQTPAGKPPSKFPRQVGDITFDPALDDPNFEICDSLRTQQYYAISSDRFEGEKYAVVKYFEENYDPAPFLGQSGFLTIRFVVNCKGETGRYRVYSEVDMDMNPQVFDPALAARLLALTKGLEGWKLGQRNNLTYDYYQYLLFKLEDGNLTEILP
ncbi:MAG TPA: hypothetical protein DCE41_26420 [Cytophagales bacterium]|nr:hypothetical protein [Cytophagales bacterium]HAA20140.1 hypothetical protein [Cytophagales bacterium]HAP60945.1 hypothetical protein [Cytophagales bacterium]